MVWMKKMLFISLIAIGLYIELSEKFNTRNIFTKIGIGFIIVGAIVHLAGHENLLVEYGILIYLGSRILCEHLRDYFGWKQSRRGDYDRNIT